MPPPGATAGSALDWQQHALVEFAVKAAETFVSAYYSASDAPKRGELLPTLYLPDSTMAWNGNAFQGSDALAQLLSQMPATKHEVLGFDCHPVHGGIDSTGNFALPTLVLSVSGVVTHHAPGSVTTLTETNAPRSVQGKRNKRAANDYGDAPIDSLPRAFSQNFVLVPGQSDGGVNVSVPLTPSANNSNSSSSSLPPPPPQLLLAGQLFVRADSFRFVG